MSVREKLDASLKDRFAYQTAEYAEPLTTYRLKEALEAMADEIDNEVATKGTHLIIKGEIQKLSLKPGDIVVIHVKKKITADDANHIALQMSDIITREGHRNEIAVFTSEMQLSVVTPDE